MNLVANKNTFCNLVNKYIKRDGVDKLLAWLERSDFYTAPASTQYNLPVEGGLCQHALNMTNKLVELFYGKPIEALSEEDEARLLENDMTLESIILVGLLCNVNKANCYVKDFKNVKVNGKWEQQEYWRWDEKFVYSGRGAKSVFILQQYIKLWVEEAQAIAFFMGGEDNIFSGVIDTTYRRIYEQSRLALYLHISELESTYYLDKLSLEA